MFKSILLHNLEIFIGKFQEENKNLIYDKLRKLAKEFHVAPIDLIGHVLEFRIDWKSTS